MTEYTHITAEIWKDSKGDGAPLFSFDVDCTYGKEHNKNVFDAVCRAIDNPGSTPPENYLGHVVVSGRNFWLPTRIKLLGPPDQKVIREVGDVYLYTPGQTVIFTYGEATETATVAKFGKVKTQPQINDLKRVGEQIWRSSVIEGNPKGYFMRLSPKQ